MSSSSDPKPQESNNPINLTDSDPIEVKTEQQNPQNPQIENEQQQQQQDQQQGVGEEEEEGECGFCLFMKGGGCKDTFVAWENCIQEAENSKEDIVEKCFQVTAALKKCMEAHSEYYEPILRAEKAAEEVAKMELEKEKAEGQGSEETVVAVIEAENQ